MDTGPDVKRYDVIGKKENQNWADGVNAAYLFAQLAISAVAPHRVQ